MEEKLALSVDLGTAIEEMEDFLKKKRAVLIVGQTSYQYPKAVNMRNGCFNGYAMYAGLKNRTIKLIVKYFKKKYIDVKAEIGKGWAKIYIE